MKPEPWRQPTVRTRVRRLTEANWLRVGVILIVLQSLVLDVHVDVRPTGWELRFRLEWRLMMKDLERSSTRKDTLRTFRSHLHSIGLS